MRILSLLGGVAIALQSVAAVNADFSADEALDVYYEQGFDTQESVNSWAYAGVNKQNTWHLVEKPYVKGLPAFTVFDPDSKYSLAVRYDDKNPSDETATSPGIEIEPDSRCEFYACFGGGLLVHSRWTLEATDAASGETAKLFDAFLWAQEVGYTGPNWNKFSIDLSDYAGKTLKFTFRYKGQGGEDVLIDGFKIGSQSGSGVGSLEISAGESVHFTTARQATLLRGVGNSRAESRRFQRKRILWLGMIRSENSE